MREITWGPEGLEDDSLAFYELTDEQRYAVLAFLEPLEINGQLEQLPLCKEGESIFCVVDDKLRGLRMFLCVDLKEMQAMHKVLDQGDEIQWFQGRWDDLQSILPTDKDY
jgi:hypothetical protein